MTLPFFQRKKHTNEAMKHHPTDEEDEIEEVEDSSHGARHERQRNHHDHDRNVTNQDDEDEDTSSTLYLVSIDSRGRSTSDLDCYKECTCSKSFFNEHISAKTQHHVVVPSPVAKLCGLDLHVYYYDHQADDSNIMFACQSEIERENNTIATLLTFDIDTGHTAEKVYGKAYVTWDFGTSPLSKRQVWGIVELIREARAIYQTKTSDTVENSAHYSAKLTLLKWCSQYQTGTWVPHNIYEPRHNQRHYHHRHHHKHLDVTHKHHHRHLDRELSGVSDQATCHHGDSKHGGHVHHDGHHECCHFHHHRHRSGEVSESDSESGNDDAHLDKAHHYGHHVIVENLPHNDRKLDIELFLSV